VKVVLRDVGDAGEDVGEPSLGIDVVHLGRDDQAIQEGGSLSAPIGTGEQPRFSSERHRPSILPMSGRMLTSIIVGIPCMVSASG